MSGYEATLLATENLTIKPISISSPTVQSLYGLSTLITETVPHDCMNAPVTKHQTEREPFAALFRKVKQERVNHQQWEQRGQSRDVVRETGRVVRAGSRYQSPGRNSPSRGNQQSITGSRNEAGVITRKHTMDRKTLRGDSRGKSRLRNG